MSVYILIFYNTLFLKILSFSIASEQQSFRVRTARRFSKTMRKTSEKSYRLMRRTSTFVREKSQNAVRRTSKFATEVDSEVSKTGMYENRFEKRRSSRQLLKKDDEHSITTLMYLYTFRQKLQKAEFLIIWTLVFALMASVIASQELFNQVYTISFVYVQYSVYSRIFAYVMDFANASVKLAEDGKWNVIPLWLILHHSGVLGSHVMIAFFFMTPQVTSNSFSKMIFGLVGTQSSHNTWTKKYSLVLYWGNVLLGFVCLSFITDISIRNTTHGGVGTTILLCSVFSTLCGVLILANTAAKKQSKQPSRPKGPPTSNSSFGIGVSYGSLDCKITEEEEEEINRISKKLSIIE